MSYFDYLSKKISTSSKDIIWSTCPHVIYMSIILSTGSHVLCLPSVFLALPFTQYTIPSSLLKEIALKMSFPSSTITFLPYQIISPIISPFLKKNTAKQINTLSSTSLPAIALSSFHKITSTSVYHGSCSLYFIINNALFKCIPVWIVNYIASLPLGVKLPKTVVCIHSLQSFTFYSLLCPNDKQILPPQFHYNFFKVNSHVLIVRSDCQFSLILTSEQHLTVNHSLLLKQCLH